MKDKKFSLPNITFSLSSFSLKFPKFWGFRIPLPGGIYLGGGKFIVASLKDDLKIRKKKELAESY